MIWSLRAQVQTLQRLGELGTSSHASQALDASFQGSAGAQSRATGSTHCMNTQDLYKNWIWGGRRVEGDSHSVKGTFKVALRLTVLVHAWGGLLCSCFGLIEPLLETLGIYRGLVCNILKKSRGDTSPRGPVVKTAFLCRKGGSNPWLGN